MNRINDTTAAETLDIILMRADDRRLAAAIAELDPFNQPDILTLVPRADHDILVVSNLSCAEELALIIDTILSGPHGSQIKTHNSPAAN
jgi:hypothetical protein